MDSLRRPPRQVFWLVGCFLALSALVVSGAEIAWDDAILRTIGGWRTPALTDVMLRCTFLGNGLIEIPMAFGVAWMLWRLGRPAYAKRYLLAGVIGEIFYLGLKGLFHRPRPSVIERLSDAGWYSYPSGHTMMGPVLWSFGFLLLASAITNRFVKALLTTGAIVIPLLLATSRVYLGVHYPSDVLGALLIGSAWVVWWWPRSESDASSASTSSAPAIK
ncbi:MAG: phosphatase PAP2 family protein [Gemmatimonadales bacterium]